MDRFEALRTFVTVVERGQISAVAERLGCAKSVVSRRISEGVSQASETDAV